MKNRQPHQYWMVILASCGLIGTSLGLCINVAGLFFLPVAEGFGVGRGAAAMTLTVYNLVHAFTGMAAPKFVTKTGLKKAVFLGTILQAGGTFLLAVCPGVTYLYVCNFLRGLGSGIIGQVTVTILIRNWFHKRTAFMTSIVMSFTGLCAAVLSPFLSGFIVSNGWRAAYVLVGFIVLIFNLPALLLPIALQPADIQLLPYGAGADTSGRGADNNAASETVPSGQSGAQTRRPAMAAFIAMLIYAAFVAAATAFPMHFPGLAASYGLAGIGAAMTSASMVANTSAKIVLGVLIDRFGALKSASVYCILTAAASICLIVFRSPMVLIASAFVFGLCFSLTTVALAMLAGDIFDKESYSSVYPSLTLAATVTNALFTTLVGTMYDFTGTYLGILLMLFVFAMGACALMHFAYKTSNRTCPEQ